MNENIKFTTPWGGYPQKNSHKNTKNHRKKLQVPLGSEASSLDFPTMSIGSIPNLQDCNTYKKKKLKLKKYKKKN